MVKIPKIGKERGDGGSDQSNFQPFDSELILLGPFLRADVSKFIEVKQAVIDAGISDDRVGQIMDWYNRERYRLLAERGDSQPGPGQS